MAKKVAKKAIKKTAKKPKETEVDDRDELDDSGIDFDVPEDVEEVKVVKKTKVEHEPDDDDEDDDEDVEEEDDEDDDDSEEPEEVEEEVEKAFSPKKYKSRESEEEPAKPVKKMHILPYLCMVFGLSSLSFFVMSLILIWIPYAFVPAAGYAIIIVMSILLAMLAYWVITRGSDSSYSVAWGGLMVPLLPLAGMMFLQRVMLELALRRAEVVEAMSRPIPALFAPIFDSTYPLPIVISIVFHAAFTIPFVIFLLRKKPFAAVYFIAAPLFFVALWFLLSPLIDQMVFAWVAYFKSL